MTQSMAYAIRVRELARMSKGQLANVWRLNHPNTVWTATPPERWNVDELTNDILRAEFPDGGAVAVVESTCAVCDGPVRDVNLDDMEPGEAPICTDCGFDRLAQLEA